MTAILLLRIHCSTNNRRVLRFLRHPSIALFTLMNCEKQFFPELADAYQQCCSFHTKSICKMRGQNPVLILGLGESPNKRKCGWVAPRHCLRLLSLRILNTRKPRVFRKESLALLPVSFPVHYIRHSFPAHIVGILHVSGLFENLDQSHKFFRRQLIVVNPQRGQE